MYLINDLYLEYIKKSSKLNNKTNNLNNKWGKCLRRHFTKDDIQTTNT